MKKVIFFLMAFVLQLSAMGQNYSPQLEQQAEDGDVDAMVELANCYFYGSGVDDDSDKGIYWLEMAADAGSIEAKAQMAKLYLEGKIVDTDVEKAFNLLADACEEGNADAIGLVGLCLINGVGDEQDYQQGMEYLRGAVEGGSVSAMNALGERYYYGDAVEQDYKKAFQWYKRAAEGGDSDGMANVGYCYEKGEGVEQDLEQALGWYEKAINMNNGDAMAYVGMWHYGGLRMNDGTVLLEQSYQDAVNFFAGALSCGSQLGYDFLSECYTKGYGVPKNKHKADLLAKGSELFAEGQVTKALETILPVLEDFEEEKTLGVQYAAEVKQPKKEVAPAPAPAPEVKQPVAEKKSQGSDVDNNIPKVNVKNENTFVVIIANENYQTESKVDFAHNDGKTFKLYCQKVLGVPDANIRIVTDATLNNIRGQVDWLHKVADAYKGKATLIFYYAGHGVPDVRSKDAYLLPVDGYASSLVTGYRLDDLYTTLSECPSRSTLVFLDACFSGSQRSGDQMKSARAVGIRAKKGTPKGNMVVYSAAQGNETAFPYKEQGHGMFTYYLLKKLQESKGNVTLGELGDYIIENVQKKSVVLHTESQTPSVNPSSAISDSWKDMPLRK